MHLPVLISDLAIILLTGGIVSVLFKKINQPQVLGYILAGFLIGPFMPWFFTVSDGASIETWSEIGIIILMFGLGLEFNLHKLLSVGGTAVITAMTEVFGMLLVGYLAGQLLGWSTMDSIFLGGMLSMSSTTIIIKAFDELNVRQEGFAQLVFGTLVIEDIAGIFMMIVLSTVSVSRSISGGALALQLGELVLYLALWLILGIYLLPTVLNAMSRLMSDETLLLFSLGVCFGMVLLADFLGFSSALGAFLAGSLLAGTLHAERIEHLTGGVKDLFGAVFFISVGMMIDPAMIWKYLVPILILSAVTIVGKLCISSLGVLFSGQPLKNAVRCGCSLAQIGEFAFIIATLGQSLGVIEDYLYPIIVSVSVITTLTTPLFIKKADKIYALIARILPAKLVERLDAEPEGESAEIDAAGDEDWSRYIKRYVKRTALFGALMAGAGLLGTLLLYPALQSLELAPALCKLITMAAIYFVMGLFVRPMLDPHSVEYTALWVKRRRNRIPLTALSGLRLLLIVALAFVPLRYVTGLGSLWLLLPLAGVVVLINRTGWLSAAYISVETRFLANLNERTLNREGSTDSEWVDEKLCVSALRCGENDGISGATPESLGWGKTYGVNIVRILRSDGSCAVIPGGQVPVEPGDTLTLIGEPDNLRTLQLALNTELPQKTLREFSAERGEKDEKHALCSLAIRVDKNSALKGKPIRDCGLREDFGCMILGLQRYGLPVLRPDVETVLGEGDILWLLGGAESTQKALSI